MLMIACHMKKLSHSKLSPPCDYDDEGDYPHECAFAATASALFRLSAARPRAKFCNCGGNSASDAPPLLALPNMAAPAPLAHECTKT